jgi:photosystem II stability/assembly factor-like uncharacterized protein
MTIFTPHSSTIFIGSNRVYKSSDYGFTVDPISTDLSNGVGGIGVVYGTITAIAVAPSDSSVIYAGTDDANLWRTQDGGITWTKINTGLPQRWVTSIAVSETDPTEVFVTYSGYRFNDSIAHVYHSLNSGSSWEDIGGNLPDIPVNDILQDPDHPWVLYLATDVGVYYSLDTGVSWQILGALLPLVPVNELALHSLSRYLYAGTYGRSMYRINIGEITGLAQVKADRLALQLYPNPIHDQFNLKFTSRNDGQAVLFIYNVQGTLMKTVTFDHIKQGVNIIRTMKSGNGSDQLPAGAYFFRLVNGKTEGVAKGIVI